MKFVSYSLYQTLLWFESVSLDSSSKRSSASFKTSENIESFEVKIPDWEQVEGVMSQERTDLDKK